MILFQMRELDWMLQQPTKSSRRDPATRAIFLIRMKGAPVDSMLINMN